MHPTVCASWLWLGATWQRGTRCPCLGRRAPACSLVTAVATTTGLTLPRSVTQLLAWVWQLWELEVVHRELNAGVSIGQSRGGNQRSVVVRVHWRIWASAMLAGYRTWGWPVIPPDPNAGGGGAQQWWFTIR